MGSIVCLLLSITLMSIHHDAIVADWDPGARVLSCIFLDGVQEEGSSILREAFFILSSGDDLTKNTTPQSGGRRRMTI